MLLLKCKNYTTPTFFFNVYSNQQQSTTKEVKCTF